MTAEKPVTKETAAKYKARYFNNPIAFQCEVLDVQSEHVWPKMVEVAESVRDNQKTCVYAGHGVSKSFEAARLVLWFLLTHKPSTVITTAPTFDQVEKVLWKEIHTACANAKVEIPGKLNVTQLDIDPKRKWFAYGFATKPDTVTGEATRAQGSHNKYVLIIIDEAAGVLSQIWKAFDSLLTDPNCKILAIGNPTAPTGAFVDCENDPTWNCITISVKDTPNFKAGRTIVPGISGVEFESMVRLKYGEDSNEYKIRVLGIKPEFGAGTYLGLGLAKAEKDGRIGDIAYEPEFPVYTFSDIGDMYSAWGFVQFIREQVRPIDFYYDCKGIGFAGYALMLQERKYKYGGHFSLPDIFKGGSNQKAGASGQYSIDVAHSVGIDFERIDLPSRDDCIRAAQDILGVCHFSAKAKEWIDGLKDWRQRKNEQLSTPDKPVYFDEAVKSWGRHVGDMTCGLGVAYRYMSVGGRILGGFTAKLPDISNASYSKPKGVFAREFKCLQS